VSHRRSKAYRARKGATRQRQKAKKRPRLLTLTRGFTVALKTPLGLLAFLGTAVGLVGGWYGLQTKIDINPEQLTDVKDPYSVPFTLVNNGSFPVYDIRWSVNWENGDYGMPNIKFEDNTTMPVGNIPSLNPSQKTAVFLMGPYSKVGANSYFTRVDGAKIKKMEVVCAMPVSKRS
jgi:hypothetical protein